MRAHKLTSHNSPKLETSNKNIVTILGITNFFKNGDILKTSDWEKENQKLENLIIEYNKNINFKSSLEKIKYEKEYKNNKKQLHKIIHWAIKEEYIDERGGDHIIYSLITSQKQTSFKFYPTEENKKIDLYNNYKCENVPFSYMNHPILVSKKNYNEYCLETNLPALRTFKNFNIYLENGIHRNKLFSDVLYNYVRAKNEAMYIPFIKEDTTLKYELINNTKMYIGSEGAMNLYASKIYEINNLNNYLELIANELEVTKVITNSENIEWIQH